MDDSKFICRSSWYDTKYVWAVEIDLVDEGGDGVGFDGNGLRASHRCLKRGTVRKCAHSVQW